MARALGRARQGTAGAGPEGDDEALRPGFREMGPRERGAQVAHRGRSVRTAASERQDNRTLKSQRALQEALPELLIEVVPLGLPLAILAVASIYAIDAVVKIASATGLSRFAARWAIVAVATSLPEIGIAAFSVEGHEVGVSVGNAFGSNAADLALIAGSSFSSPRSGRWARPRRGTRGGC